MKNRFLRFLSLFSACFLIVLLPIGASASQNDVTFTVDFDYSYDDGCYYSVSGDDAYLYAVEYFHSKLPFSLNSPFASLSFDPYDYYVASSGVYYFFTPSGVLPDFACYTVDQCFYVGMPSTVKDYYGWPDSISTVLTFPPAPAGPGSLLLSDLTETAAAFLATCGQIADAIVSTPLLLFTVGIFFLGGCVAILGRFLDKE